MSSKNLVRQLLILGLVALGIGLECCSCCREILRDGNEPIAGAIGLLGLFCIGAGWAAYRSSIEPMAEARQVRLSLVFEHLAYFAALVMLWLLAQRQPFFVDTPFGRDILALHTILIVVLAAVVALSVAFRNSLSVDRGLKLFPFPASQPARRALAFGLIVIGTFNVVQAKEIIRLSNGMHVSILSRGFPLPAFEKLRLDTERMEITPQDHRVSVLTLPSGTQVRFGDDTITIVRYPGQAQQLSRGVHKATLSDGTRVEFGEGKIQLFLGHGTGVALDLGSSTAQFIDGAKERVDVIRILIDAFIGILLAVHLAVCAERIERSGGFQGLSNG